MVTYCLVAFCVREVAILRINHLQAKETENTSGLTFSDAGKTLNRSFLLLYGGTQLSMPNKKSRPYKLVGHRTIIISKDHGQHPLLYWPF